MDCAACGTPNSDREDFCHNCGKRFADPEPVTRVAPAEPSWSYRGPGKVCFACGAISPAQETLCQSCGKTLAERPAPAVAAAELVVSAEPARRTVATPSVPAGPSYREGRKRCLSCGAINPFAAKHCDRCGKTWTLAAPTPAKQRTASRQGGQLLVPRDASLPSFCIKCGQPAKGEPVVQTFWAEGDWDSHGSYGGGWADLIVNLAVLTSPVVLAILAVPVLVGAGVERASDEPFFVFVPLCREHRQRYEGYRTAAWTLTLGAVPAAILVGLGVGEEGPGAALVTIVALAAAAAIAWHLARLLRAKGVGSSFGMFTGACQEFLSRVPSQ